MNPDSPQHGRRNADVERRRWNDDRLDDLAHSVRALGPLATQVARHDAVLDQLVEDVAGFRGEISDFRTEYREDRDQAKQGRGAIVISAITAASAIVVALIGAIALVLTGGPT